MNKSRQEYINDFVNNIRPAQSAPQWGGVPADELPCRGERMDITLRDGEKIRAIVYPQQGREKSSVLFQIHGGHFYSGYAETDDDVCVRFRDGSKCCVISIDYRLAPEYPFPYAIDDCIDVIKYFIENAEKYNIDASKIGISGECGGAGIALGVCFKANDTKAFKASYLQITSPSLDRSLENVPSSTPDIEEKYTRISCCYCDVETEGINPYVSPAYATEDMIKLLPPTFIVLAGDDNELGRNADFASSMLHAGVDVSVRCYANVPHNFMLNYAKTWRGEVSEAAYAFMLEGVNKYL